MSNEVSDKKISIEAAIGVPKLAVLAILWNAILFGSYFGLGIEARNELLFCVVVGYSLALFGVAVLYWPMLQRLLFRPGVSIDLVRRQVRTFITIWLVLPTAGLFIGFLI